MTTVPLPVSAPPVMHDSDAAQRISLGHNLTVVKLDLLLSPCWSARCASGRSDAAARRGSSRSLRERVVPLLLAKKHTNSSEGQHDNRQTNSDYPRRPTLCAASLDVR